MEALRLLYLEDDTGDQALTRRHLERHAPHVKLAIVGTLAEARARMSAGDIDLILSDYRLPDGTGLDLLEAANAGKRPVPVVLVTGSGDPEAAVRLLKAGAADYLVKRPGYLETLPAVIDGAFRWFRSVGEIRRTPVRILYAEGDAADAESTRSAFAEAGRHFQVEVVSRGREALDRLRTAAFDLFLLDYRVPDLSSIELLKALREARLRTPVVMVTDHGHEETAVQAFKLGVADYIVKREGYLAKLVPTVEQVLSQQRLADEKDALLVLHDLTRTIASLQGLDSLIRRVARAAADLLRAERSVLWLTEGTELCPAGWVGIEDSAARALRVPVSAGTLDPVPSDRLARPWELRDEPAVAGVVSRLAPNGRWAAVWLLNADRPVGMLAVASDQRRTFGTTDERLLAILADHAAIAIHNARLYEQLQAELDARARLTAILEATTDLVWIADVSGRLLYVNGAGRTMLGFAPEEDLASFSVAGCVPERTREAIVGEVIPAVIRDGLWSGETLLLSREGREIPVSLVGVAHRSSDGTVEFLSTIARDITERTNLEQQLRQAQKMEAVGRLAGGVAHDFNNVLTAITGYSELLSKEMGQDHPMGRDVEEVKKAADRAAALTRQLLAFSRQQVLKPRVLDVNAVVADVETMLRRLIGEDVELVVLPASGLGRVQADPSQLEQVLLNLAINARDAMPVGGKLTIETANVDLDEAYARRHVSVPPGRYVMLAVSDTGCGMDAETQARIFEPFFTTKEQGKGTGLGLSTVYGIVKQSGGHIWVYSEPGRGTTFKVYLPRVEAPLQGPARITVPAEPARGTETILLVEDDAGVRALAGRVLQESGYTVLEARDGAEALRISRAHEGEIGLVISDLVMPGTSGPEVAKQLTALRPGVKVVFISGYTDNAIFRQHALEPGTAFLDKPFTPKALVKKVREVLDAGDA